jgi:predicted CXXCH cytochrome family protein
VGGTCELRLLASVIAWAAFSALVACGGSRNPAGHAAAGSSNDGYVKSNILRGDYAGSRACAPCHADLYRAWEGSPMHRMTRVADTAEVRAPFDGRKFRFKDDAVTLTTEGGARFVAVSSKAFGDHVYRVTRVIGGRYREDFAGVEVLEPRAAAKPVRDPKDELVLPVTFVFSPASFRLKGYSVMVAERPGLRAGGVWNQTCIFCHNTAPYFSSLFGELYGPSAPGYQGEVVDRLLPPERRSALSVERPGDLAKAATDELRFLGSKEAPGGAARALESVLKTTRKGFDASHLVEVGIGCESCHGGSREHVANVRVKPSFEIRSSFVRALPSSWEEKHRPDARARAIDRVCARCHQVLFSRYPFTWEGGRRTGDAGGSHISSGEARDFLLGGCGSALACTACHDPHAADQREALGAFDSPAKNDLCVGCHDRLKGRAAQAAHTHHDPSGAGSACLACHMPRKNMGLGYELTRYHRIGSPTDEARVERDRPLECALCHADKSVGELVGAMERFWGKRYDRARLAELYGDLGASPLLATLARGKAHEQATAIHTLGERGVRSALGSIAEQLVNPYPLVRYFARGALEKLAGQPCDVDLDRDDADIEAAARRWLSSLSDSSFSSQRR